MEISTIEYLCKYCGRDISQSDYDSNSGSWIDVIGNTEYISEYNINDSSIKQFLKKLGVSILVLCIGFIFSFLGILFPGISILGYPIFTVFMGMTFLYFLFRLMWIIIGFFKLRLRKSRNKKWENRRGERDLEVYITTHDLKQHDLIKNWLSGNNVLVRSDIIGLSLGIGYYIIYMTQEILDKLNEESQGKGLYIDFNRDLDIIHKS